VALNRRDKRQQVLKDPVSANSVKSVVVFSFSFRNGTTDIMDVTDENLRSVKPCECEEKIRAQGILDCSMNYSE
jgi:hypothetical protein